MGLISRLKSNKCDLCKNHRNSRYCIRLNKKICWHCCNETRVDKKCTENCKYHLIEIKDTKGPFSFKASVDSRMEYIDLIKKAMDKWIILPQDHFDNKIPINMTSEAEKAELTSYFEAIPDNEFVPINYLLKRLDLPLRKTKISPETPEDVAEKFLSKIIEQDWEATIPMRFDIRHFDDPEIKKNYIQRISSHKTFKKITQYSLISSALTEKQDEGLVHFDIFLPFDFTLYMKKRKQNWFVKTIYLGPPELFKLEDQNLKSIAYLLSQNQLGNVNKVLKSLSKTYPESADLFYYWGMYYMLSNEVDKAKPYFLTAYELDYTFSEAIYHLGFIEHKNNNKSSAKEYYLKSLDLNPSDVKAMNNLATIFEEEGNLLKAKSYLNNCLKIQPDFEFAQKNLDRIRSKED